MKAFKYQLLVTTLAFIVSGSACAGFNEKTWDFKKDEVVSIDYSQSPEKLGSEYGCTKFTPSTVSFMIEYELPSEVEGRIQVEADAKVTHDKKEQRYTVYNASQLHISFPYGGSYIVKNITGKDVKGLVCDAGIY
ncbi:hypothetical protein [Erwinia piriflorinigrans]|uniref:Lipoprotein n=1 Tax=Erwinia piriflorinigrans CFBP 5888 TaxID=1161919 RepID=V5ZC21_9GAMM|nr:hypothetical protein [Erwinia piriflorinigrans]CCG88474.1 hypothetical protein EPIR_3111 [Erwinia piriflorinigrans CFBP 5888]